VVVGIHVLTTGSLRSIVSLGQMKYLVGSVSIVAGLYLIVATFLSSKRQR
jgi:hypothetical protein